MREIEDVEENIETNPSLAKRFTELDDSKKLDESAKALLDDLKYRKIPSKLPDSNIFKFKVLNLNLVVIFRLQLIFQCCFSCFKGEMG